MSPYEGFGENRVDHAPGESAANVEAHVLIADFAEGKLKQQLVGVPAEKLERLDHGLNARGEFFATLENLYDEDMAEALDRYMASADAEAEAVALDEIAKLME